MFRQIRALKGNDKNSAGTLGAMNRGERPSTFLLPQPREKEYLEVSRL